MFFEVIRSPIFLGIFKEHPIPSYGLSLGNRRKSFFFLYYRPTHFSKFGAMNNRPKIAQFFKDSAFRLLRILGILLVLYVSMVFYLALTERRNAFPRAIYHKEANEAIQGKAKTLTCTLEDGTALGGFSLGDENSPVLLYYPEADEDAAQFLAQIDSLPGINIVTFNYRGSAQNKGTPSEENFENDAKQIAECAAQVNGNRPRYLAGRGMGAISAINQSYPGQTLLLIDPILDIADAISQKYRFLYPKFLVRSNFKADKEKLSGAQEEILVIYDKKSAEEQSKAAAGAIVSKAEFYRQGQSLSTIIKQAISKILTR